MKHPIIAFLFCFGLLHSLAAEPLIPAALNAILPKIHAGMLSPRSRAMSNQKDSFFSQGDIVTFYNRSGRAVFYISEVRFTNDS